MQLILNAEKHTPQTYFKKTFKSLELEWKVPYLDE